MMGGGGNDRTGCSGCYPHVSAGCGEDGCDRGNGRDGADRAGGSLRCDLLRRR